MSDPKADRLLNVNEAAEMLVDPERAADVPTELIPTVLSQLAAVQSALVARLGTLPHTESSRASQSGDRLLTVDDVAGRTQLSNDYIYRHSKNFPFTRRIGRTLRFSEKGLDRWLAARRKG